ncbi:MAG: S4 domain-containing protein, partial [Saprospiraceae bacterium]
MGDLNKVRLDKWLWAVRLFKSRTMATDACKAGKIKLNGHSLKPSYLIIVGETIEVKKNG